MCKNGVTTTVGNAKQIAEVLSKLLVSQSPVVGVTIDGSETELILVRQDGTKITLAQDISENWIVHEELFNPDNAKEFDKDDLMRIWKGEFLGVSLMHTDAHGGDNWYDFGTQYFVYDGMVYAFSYKAHPSDPSDKHITSIGATLICPYSQVEGG